MKLKLFILLSFLYQQRLLAQSPSNLTAFKKNLSVAEVRIPSGEFDMGDHFGFVDPNHPSDELPIHKVKVNALYVGRTEITNQQFLIYLNAALQSNLIEVRSNIVYAKGDTNIYCYTNQYASYYSIAYNGTAFSFADFRANHPMVGVMWYGAAAFCNWLSLQNNLEECYNLKSWICDFTKTGYRLPTEAEWEWAGRGGHTNPYYNYPWGNDVDNTKANWDNSKDPYEGTSSAVYPYTTPVGFYDGSLKLKTDFNWPGTMSSYQTGNGANSFGLYDMAGNVWEFVNDWYGQNYYTSSPYDNPKGPASGFIMPDGKPYRGMRGGNWYNGDLVSGVSDGHSRVSNRNPSYYRGPQDPNHPWYHIGFRVFRNDTSSNASGMVNVLKLESLVNIYPNPTKHIVNIVFDKIDADVSITLYTASGIELNKFFIQKNWDNKPSFQIDMFGFSSGFYYLIIGSGNEQLQKKLLYNP